MKFFIYPATVALALTMGASAFAADCSVQARTQAQKTPETMKAFTDVCGKAGDSNINNNGPAGTGNSGAARSGAPNVGTGLNSGPNVPGTTSGPNSAVMPNDTSGRGTGTSGGANSGVGTSGAGGGNTGASGSGTGTGGTSGAGGASGGGTR